MAQQDSRITDVAACTSRMAKRLRTVIEASRLSLFHLSRRLRILNGTNGAPPRPGARTRL